MDDDNNKYGFVSLIEVSLCCELLRVCVAPCVCVFVCLCASEFVCLSVCACLRVTLPSAIVPASPPSCASPLAFAVNVYPTPLLQCLPSSPAPVDIHRPTCTAAVCSVPALEPRARPTPSEALILDHPGGRASDSMRLRRRKKSRCSRPSEGATQADED